MLQHFKIAGLGGYLPARAITAEELDARLGLPAGWTLQHTGVAVRRERAADENATMMGRAAARAALAAAGVSVRDLDVIVDASTTQQQPIPCNAALLQEALGPEAAGIPALDVHCTCLSFIVALATVNAWFAAGMYRRALIVSAETPLNGVNWRDPASACLMGDGAAAAVVERAAEPCGGFCYRHETYAAHAHVCEVKGGGHRLPPFSYSESKDDLYRFAMDGPRLHKAASKHLPALVQAVLAESRLTMADLHVVPHQASGPAVTLLGRRLGLPRERLHVSLATHGNLVAAGIPFALGRAGKRIPNGAPVMLLGTAAGYAQAAMVFRR